MISKKQSILKKYFYLWIIIGLSITLFTLLELNQISEEENQYQHCMKWGKSIMDKFTNSTTFEEYVNGIEPWLEQCNDLVGKHDHMKGYGN